jgi:hypothetical protein
MELPPSEAAYRALLSRARRILPIQALAAVAEPRPALYAFLELRDDDTCLQLFDAYDAVRSDLPGPVPPLHVVFLAGRDVADFLKPRPPHLFERT